MASRKELLMVRILTTTKEHPYLRCGVAIVMVGACAVASYLGGYLANYSLRFALILSLLFVAIIATYSFVRIWRSPTKLPECVATLLCILTLCVGARYQPFEKGFEQGLRSNLNQEVLLRWTYAMLSEKGGSDEALYHRDFPVGVVRGTFPAPDGIRIRGDHIDFIWGSSMAGQWGLSVGSTNFVGRGVRWQPGVFFCVWM
jgi:hypothetical protein